MGLKCLQLQIGNSTNLKLWHVVELYMVDSLVDTKPKYDVEINLTMNQKPVFLLCDTLMWIQALNIGLEIILYNLENLSASIV